VTPTAPLAPASIGFRPASICDKPMCSPNLICVNTDHTGLRKGSCTDKVVEVARDWFLHHLKAGSS
jgi:hypothetical protein